LSSLFFHYTLFLSTLLVQELLPLILVSLLLLQLFFILILNKPLLLSYRLIYLVLVPSRLLHRSRNGIVI
jgi:hypothetical protein